MGDYGEHVLDEEEPSGCKIASNNIGKRIIEELLRLVGPRKGGDLENQRTSGRGPGRGQWLKWIHCNCQH